MIIDIPSRRRDGGSNFAQLCAYIASAADYEKTIYTNTLNLNITSEDGALSAEQAAREMRYNAYLNKRIKDPVFHAVLSFREGEIPTTGQVDEAVRIYLAELGMEYCHAYYGVHANTKNIHVHVCVSRVDPDTQRGVTPADGFTYKANERAARKIELTQGWTLEKSGHLCGCVDGHVVDYADAKKADKAICGKAKDFEHYTAEKSAIRIAKEELSGVLFDTEIKTWEALHKGLAAKGARLEKKGSGAVLIVGGVMIKLSSVSQALSMSKLAKRLGEFKARDGSLKINERQPQPLRNTNAVSAYIQARHEFYHKKREIEEELYKRRQQGRKLLIEKQKEETKALYGERGTWKGRGAQLNALRSELALKHVREKQAFKAYYKQEKKKMPYSFPSYKEWEQGRGNNRTADLWRYRASMEGALTGGDKFVTPRQSRAVFGYGTSWDKWAKSLQYFKGYKLAFADKGRRIEVHDWEDRDVIKDVLMLAQEKWGGVTLHGSEQYVAACMAVAVENGINIRNPELQEKMRALREAKQSRYEYYLSQCKNAKSAAIFTSYCAAVGAEKYRITVEEQNGGITRRTVIGGRRGAEGLLPEEAVEQWQKISQSNNLRRNVYVAPLSKEVNHIVISGLSAASLKALKQDGYRPAAVIMDADEAYSVVINAPKLRGGGAGRAAAERAVKELRAKIAGRYAATNEDRDTEHLLPGFGNYGAAGCKEDERADAPEVKLCEKKGGICKKAEMEEKTILGGIITREKRKKVPAQRPFQQRERTPYGAYMVHAKDIIGSLGSGVSVNWNKLDAMVAVRMRVTGFDQKAIEEAVAKGGFDIRPENERGKLFTGHAKRIADYAGSVAGEKAANRYLGCRRKWLQLEGSEGRAAERRTEGIGL